MTSVEEIDEVITKTMYVTMTARMIFLAPAMMLLIHWPAGDWAWLDGWFVVGGITLLALVAVLWLVRVNPELVVERLKGNFQSRGYKS